MNFIPIIASGGIGDLIISLAWIENVIKPLNVPIYLYSVFPEIASYFLPWISLSKDAIHAQRIAHSFDYFITISDLIFFEKSPNKILPAYIQPLYNIFKNHKQEWELYSKVHPHNANAMAHKALLMGRKRWTLPFHFVDKSYQPYILKQEVKDIQVPQRFITIHDGFDASGYYKFERSMKSWSVEYWEEFIKIFKDKYPDIHVIQLGGVKHKKFKRVDINYAGQLTFQDSLRYLKSSLMHIDGDSGLVHARRLFNKPSVVLFGPTNINYFGYPENINLAPKFCGDCWWKNTDWMARCKEGYSTPKCLDSIKPKDVLNAIKL